MMTTARGGDFVAHPVSGKHLSWTVHVVSGDLVLEVGLVEPYAERRKAERVAVSFATATNPSRMFVVLDAERHF